MPVSQRADCDPTAHVKIPFSVRVPNVASLTALEHKIETGISRQDEAGEGFANVSSHSKNTLPVLLMFMIVIVIMLIIAKTSYPMVGRDAVEPYACRRLRRGSPYQIGYGEARDRSARKSATQISR